MKVKHNVNINIHVLLKVVLKKKNIRYYFLDTTLCVETQKNPR